MNFSGLFHAIYVAFTDSPFLCLFFASFVCSFTEGEHMRGAERERKREGGGNKILHIRHSLTDTQWLAVPTLIHVERSSKITHSALHRDLCKMRNNSHEQYYLRMCCYVVVVFVSCEELPALKTQTFHELEKPFFSFGRENWVIWRLKWRKSHWKQSRRSSETIETVTLREQASLCIFSSLLLQISISPLSPTTCVAYFYLNSMNRYRRLAASRLSLYLIIHRLMQWPNKLIPVVGDKCLRKLRCITTHQWLKYGERRIRSAAPKCMTWQLISIWFISYFIDWHRTLLIGSIIIASNHSTATTADRTD